MTAHGALFEGATEQDFFGELALLNPRTPRSATVIALEKAETAVGARA